MAGFGRANHSESGKVGSTKCNRTSGHISDEIVLVVPFHGASRPHGGLSIRGDWGAVVYKIKDDGVVLAGVSDVIGRFSIDEK